MGIKTKKQAGFSTLETLLSMIIIAIIAGVGGYVLHSSKPAKSQTPARPVKQSSAQRLKTSELVIKEWKVKMTLPEGVADLSYELTKPTTQTGYGGPNYDQPYTSQQPGFVKLFSPKLKGKPSSCNGETLTSGEFASIDKSTTAPGQPQDGNSDAKHFRKVGNNYYSLSKPNGFSCQSSESLRQLESQQTDLVTQAFQTLREQ